MGRGSVIAVLVAVLVVGALLGCRAAPPAPSTAPKVGGTEAPLSVLRAWDERRAAAYAAGDAAALRSLYRTGSTAGDRDVRLLRRYARRGLRVTGLQTQVLAAEVLSHAPDRVVLVVTERLAGGVAVGPGTRVRLPRSAPRDRVVVLVRSAAGWLVTAVREPERSRHRR